MPRRKKSGQSPARVPGGSLDHNAGQRLPQGFDGAMANNFSSSGGLLSTSDKENIVKNMQEMFSHLDPEVIYIVLSECDFKGTTNKTRKRSYTARRVTNVTGNVVLV